MNRDHVTFVLEPLLDEPNHLSPRNLAFLHSYEVTGPMASIGLGLRYFFRRYLAFGPLAFLHDVVIERKRIGLDPRISIQARGA